MKKAVMAVLLFLPVLALLGATRSTAQTPWVEGTWEVAWENRIGEVHEFTVTLQEEGEKLSGSAEIPLAFFSEDAEEGTREVEIVDGDTHGRMVTFKILQAHGHHEMMQEPMMTGHDQMSSHVIALYGVVDDTEMEGYLTGVMGDPATAVPFEATKLY